MVSARSRPDPLLPLRYRWLAPVLLLAILAGLGPLWWKATAPPELAVAKPWRDPGGTLLVPQAAVRPPGPAGRVEAAGPATVFVVRDGRALATRVRLGDVRADAVEVREGLAEAAFVVANPPVGLEDRHRVLVKP